MRRRTNTKHNSEAEASAKERLRLIVDTIPTIIWRKFPDGSADFLNQRFREYTGLSLQQGLGWGWINAFHPDDCSMEEWRAALTAGKPFVGAGQSSENEMRLRRADCEYQKSGPVHESLMRLLRDTSDQLV